MLVEGNKGPGGGAAGGLMAEGLLLDCLVRVDESSSNRCNFDRTGDLKEEASEKNYKVGEESLSSYCVMLIPNPDSWAMIPQPY